VPLPMRLRSVVLAAALAIALILPTALPHASASTTVPGSSLARWRVVKVIGPENGVTYPGFLSVTSRDDAWSWWNSSCASCPGQGSVSFLEHWNGTRWIKKTPPAAAESGIVGLGASSQRNLWLFTVDTIRGHAVKRALIWNGSWHTIRLPDWTISFSRAGFYAAQPEVFGPRSVWLFELALRAVDVYNGHRWTRHALPGYPGDINVISPTDIWAIGRGKSFDRQFLMHWNGARWRTLQIPRPARIPKNSIEYVSGLVATAPHDLWLARYIETGSQGARTLYLLHWARGRWHKVPFRFPTSWALLSAQDGHGGLWMASNGPAPHYHWYFDHLSRSGYWTRGAGPTVPGTNFGQSSVLAPMAWIPGTISVWATGNLDPQHSNDAILGAIFKYGP